ncbi:phosphoribosyl-ATP pyrophosphohydrolase [Rhodococcus sp. PAMC28707]|uniref:nucleoside triphosphate pyrophosphohydrolase n=1 Tax=unclassified Rhodococcus (in: high G+C Gram-positive bacteria) TaxID=192944 RepID=UPI00109DA2BE|nr:MULTISPECIES: nucleoside triphosphate pyrophosphohydrolase [unclassified Rhodococcus (in: high G+C Gram-positive bacteria)]QCB51969.1 phosphoribosyl-ATP pyrophosphohydrolase [Rhodococcus sp. PAMC28705]QCB59861.1 phosphoribosyl-ATP pyrophosphohydrolase [Rhodococcus sp. PAMC28707]
MGKLVRDLIPSIIEASGRVPKYRTLNPRDYGNALIDKLFEEADEFREAMLENRREELADILEVVRALAAHLGLTDAALDDLAVGKRAKRGGFEKRIWLE